MLHARVQRFDVMENLKKIYKILGTKPALSYGPMLRPALTAPHLSIASQSTRERSVSRLCRRRRRRMRQFIYALFRKAATEYFQNDSNESCAVQ